MAIERRLFLPASGDSIEASEEYMASETSPAQSTIEASSVDRHLKLVLFDLYTDPEDVSVWSGIPAAIIQGLRNAGQQVTTAGLIMTSLRRIITMFFWHYYSKVRKLHYVSDRQMAMTRFFSTVGNWKVRDTLENADAIITTSTTATGFLKTDKQIFVIHDATWAQVLELYPYFDASVQVPHVVRGGFEMERKTFTLPNVTLILTSDWAANRAISDYGLDRSRVFVLPFGPNFTADPPREQVYKAINARNGKHCNLLCVGREFDRKGGWIAVETAAALQTLGIPTTLHVVGCSPEGLPPWVEIYGLLRKDRKDELDRLHALYAESDFFIMPTQAEAQGIVFIEAAAYGLPVVATDVGGVSAVVKNGDWGLLLATNAPGEQFASWIAGLFRDRARYVATAHRARADYEARLSRSAYTKRLMEIIRGRLNKESPYK